MVKLQYILAAFAGLGLALLVAGRRRRSLGVTGAVVLVFLAGYLAGYLSYRPYTAYVWRRYFARLEARYQNKSAPDVSSPTSSGTPWHLRDEIGKVVVLDFWASWCGPCERVIPPLKSLQAAFGSRDDFKIVGVALDENCDAAIAAAKDRGMSWLQTCEGKAFDNSVARAFGINELPSLWVIDRMGRVQGVRVRETSIESRIQELLAESNTRTPTTGMDLRSSNYSVNATVRPVTALANPASAAPVRPARLAVR